MLPNLQRHKVKRKYKSKFPYQVCTHGVRSRKIYCSRCKAVRHPGCTEGMNNNIFDILTSNNEVIIFRCDSCKNNSDVSNSNMTDKNNSDEIINVSNNEESFICNYCEGKLKNSNFSECKHCKGHFHFRCFKNVSNNEKFCKLCFSKELPFHDMYVDFDLDDNENSNITYPSEMPDF